MKHIFAKKIENPHLGNLGKITDSIYRGAEPDQNNNAGYLALKAMGIKTVVSFRSWKKENTKVADHGMIPISIPLIADLRGSTPPTEDQLRYFFYVLKDHAMHPIFFHCLHGADRTGTMAAIYRMEIDGWSNEEAFNEMQEFGFHDNWLDLIKFIKNYKPKGCY